MSPANIQHCFVICKTLHSTPCTIDTLHNYNVSYCIAQSSSVVRTIVSRCAHNCLSLCAQLTPVVRTIDSRCAHN